MLSFIGLNCFITYSYSFQHPITGWGDYFLFILSFRYKLLQTFRPVLCEVFYCVGRLGKQHCVALDMKFAFSILCIWYKPAQRKRRCLQLLVIF